MAEAREKVERSPEELADDALRSIEERESNDSSPVFNSIKKYSIGSAKGFAKFGLLPIAAFAFSLPLKMFALIDNIFKNPEKPQNWLTFKKDKKDK